VIDPRESYKSAEQHARQVQKTGTRVIFSALGFSAAYFLDPEHGASRRRQAVGLIRRSKSVIDSRRATKGERGSAGSEAPAAASKVPRSADAELRIAR
jgi:hypothetical protein